MLKIISTGKGGVGKTTTLSTLATMMQREGKKVIVFDTDPSMNLAMSLGIPFETVPTITEDKAEINDELEDNDLEEIGGEIIRKHSRVNIDGIRVVVMGAIQEGGSGCLCSAISTVKILLSYVESDACPERYDVAFVDSQAGPEILGRGLAREFDWNLVLTEPTPKSAEVSRQVVKLANDLGVKRDLLIINKSESADDIAKVSSMVGVPPEHTVRVPYDRSVIQSDWDNRMLLDAYPDCAAVASIGSVKDMIEGGEWVVRVHSIPGRARGREHRRAEGHQGHRQGGPRVAAEFRREDREGPQRQDNQGRHYNDRAAPEDQSVKPNGTVGVFCRRPLLP